VVNFMACTTTPDVCLVQEYVERGSLYKVLHDRDILLEMGHVLRFALDTCQGMAYLHGSRIIHRDLKSHNLLVDKDWNIKVCDFGLSRVLEETHRSSTLTACGTPCWTAPEILRGKRYTVKADVYSFGICLWEMVTREDPFAGTPPYQVVINVATKGARPAINKTMPAAFTKMMTQCWAECHDTRPSFGNLIEILKSMEFPKTSQFPITLKSSSSSGSLNESVGTPREKTPANSPQVKLKKSKGNPLRTSDSLSGKKIRK